VEAVVKWRRKDPPENTVQHRGGSGGSMAANHRSGGESSMVVTTLKTLRDTDSRYIGFKFAWNSLFRNRWRKKTEGNPGSPGKRPLK